MKNKFKQLLTILSISSCIILASPKLQASTESRQLQVSADLGMMAGSDNVDTSFDFALEPEFFIFDKLSASFRFDVTAGDLDSVHLGSRIRYYFDVPDHDKWSVYVGAGAGFIINLDNGGHHYGDIALPVVGFQYDLTDNIKIGSDFSFDILIGDDSAIAARIMPIQFRWAF